MYQPLLFLLPFFIDYFNNWENIVKKVMHAVLLLVTNSLQIIEMSIPKSYFIIYQYCMSSHLLEFFMPSHNRKKKSKEKQRSF